MLNVITGGKFRTVTEKAEVKIFNCPESAHMFPFIHLLAKFYQYGT